ncbi:HAMP domain-containing sensor histidine kinase [Bacillus sp. FJAT-50079]|uniref:sensor histidine kinase n=1 Tax=Bacillus sp. FJAT-50079 TaxID=2833577 RepID=UPI001BC96ED7|nr:HAMP domain-containing sensor histidine kinase [Bacillus sp. FJAT-50079]MBS4209106.1 two-component sensor histidine kinase [Bacillus sp. FJAT-50079]
MNLPKTIKRIFGFLAIILSLLLCWSCSYWFTSWLFAEIQYTPSEYAIQLINSILGFFLFGLCMFFITKIKWVQDHQVKMIHPIIHAMKMMAEGNFNIDLSFYDQEQFQDRNHPYSYIVENINNMASKLGAMEEMRQEFISNVSHEIQSPLTSINGFAHALKNDELSPNERKRYLEIIEMESTRLSKLSENLLKLTSLESDQLGFDQQTYRLDHQLRRIILANEPQWAEKEIQMDIYLEHITITANEDLLDQVWINLLHNSIKFTPRNGTITIEARKKADHDLIVKIKDTGIGMNQEALIHIFERFYKADQSRTRHFGGSGLGLPIVKKIIDLHKGAIQVQSELGKGTEVTVKLN